MDVLEAHAQTFAKRLVSALEGAPLPSDQRRRPQGSTLEAALLEGADAPTPLGALIAAAPRADLESRAEAQLRADLCAVLRQRSELRAKLIAEQERRERAEAELVAIGAQWHGTDTQRALQRRAEAEAQRGLDAQTAAIARTYAQKLAQVQAEKTLLRKKLASGAAAVPTDAQLRAELRAALQAELEMARREAQLEAQAELARLRERCDFLERRLRAAESRHGADTDVLRQALRRADTLCQEQWDCGFVAGLKKAAEALGHTGGAGGAAAAKREPRAQTQPRGWAAAVEAESTGPGGASGVLAGSGGLAPRDGAGGGAASAAADANTGVLQGLVIKAPVESAVKATPSLGRGGGVAPELSSSVRARLATEEGSSGEEEEEARAWEEHRRTEEAGGPGREQLQGVRQTWPPDRPVASSSPRQPPPQADEDELY